MAIYAPIHGEMRGKLGGNVYSRNKGGTYVRIFAAPTNPNTIRQQSVRNWIGWAATAWESTLTEEQRDAWREWAQANPILNSLGQSIYISGMAWYATVNSRLLDCAASVIATPGDLTKPEPLLTATLAFTDDDAITITFTPALESGYRLQLWGSGPISAGRSPNFRACRLIGYSAADVASPAAFALPYAVPETKKLKVFVGVMSDRGRVSTFLSDEAIYTAP